MDPRLLKEFAQRDRQLPRALKEEYWAEQRRRSGGQASFQLGQILYEHMRAIRPDWPSDAERSEDLAHHVELKRRLSRTADVRRP